MKNYITKFIQVAGGITQGIFPGDRDYKIEIYSLTIYDNSGASNSVTLTKGTEQIIIPIAANDYAEMKGYSDVPTITVERSEGFSVTPTGNISIKIVFREV